MAKFLSYDFSETSLQMIDFGRFYAAVAKTAFKGDGQESLHHFW